MVDGYDCIVIGSGPGGYVAAVRAAQLGLRTAIVERDALGGRCLNSACIPAKAVLRVADVLSEIDHAGEFGISVASREVDFSAVATRRAEVVKTLTTGVAGLMKKNDIDVLKGEGSLAAEGRVRIGEAEHAAGAVILAAGSVPRPIPGVELGGRVIDTAGAWLLDEQPRRLAVAGAGASGAEIASAYGRLGTEVSLFEALDRVLPLEDADVSRIAARSLAKQNVAIHLDTRIDAVRAGADEVELTAGGGDQVRTVDYLVIAAGRGADVAALGLEGAGVELDDRGLVAVDGAMRTSAAGVYAIGDLVHGPALAHKASDEGIIAAENVAGRDTHPLDYDHIPRATFCTPNVGSFGLSEQQARDAGHDVVVGKLPYGAVGAGTVYGDRSGMIKIVGDRRYGELLGGHIVGSKATELIAELVTTHALEGGYPEVARIVHGHPTLSEGVMEAARAADGWLIHG